MIPAERWARRYFPRGAVNAKPRADIRKDMAMDGFIIADRTFRNKIKKAVRKKKLLVCSTSQGGYYIPQSDEDMAISRREDNSRIHQLIADREAKDAMWREKKRKSTSTF